MAIESKDLKAKAEENYREIRTAKNIHAPDKNNLKNKIINDINGILAEEIRKQIKDLSNPCILLVGDNDKALLAACYAHCSRDIDYKNLINKFKERRAEILKEPRPKDAYLEGTSTSPPSKYTEVEPTATLAKELNYLQNKFIPSMSQFKYVNCFGEDLITLKEKVGNWLKDFSSRHTVFLSRLKSEDIKVCKQFARDIEKIKIEKPASEPGVFNELDIFSELGLFIIGVDSKCDLPEYLRRHFESIELDPDKIEEVITRPTTSGEQLRYLAKVASDPKREDEIIETVVMPVTEQTKAKGIASFPTPPGSKWSDVEITFIDNEYVRIKVENEVKNRVHYSEMGFKDEGSGKPIKLWRDTLRKFALANGVIPPKHDKFGKLIETVSVDDVKRLRKKLQSYFGISGDPISYIKGKYIKGKYIEAEGYKTLFRIKDESHIQDSVYNNQE